MRTTAPVESVFFSVCFRQFARPAVELSVLLQMKRTPPVDSASSLIWPPVTFSSNSAKKSSHILCFCVSKSLLACISDRLRLVGLDDFRGEVVGESEESSSSRGRKRFFLGETSGFCGEY